MALNSEEKIINYILQLRQDLLSDMQKYDGSHNFEFRRNIESKTHLKILRIYKYGSYKDITIFDESRKMQNADNIYQLASIWAKIEISKLSNENDSSKEPKKMKKEMSQCRCVHQDGSSQRCPNEFAKSSTYRYTCVFHSKVIYFIKSAIEFNRCDMFTTFPRCTRNTDNSNLNKCKLHLQTEFHDVFAIPLEEVNYTLEENYRFIINEREFEKAYTDVTKKLATILELDKNVCIYIGITIGTGETRHAGKKELPIGSIIKDLIYISSKNAAQRMEGKIIDYINQSFGRDRLINLAKGGQESSAENFPHTVYAALIRNQYSAFARGQTNRTNNLQPIPVVHTETSTLSEICDLGMILGSSLVKNFPTSFSLSLIKYFNLLYTENEIDDLSNED